MRAGNERILFVDDELTIVQLGQQLLEGMGYEVVTRTSSVEALELFNSRSTFFDAIHPVIALDTFNSLSLT